jgi:hypothetical protein
MKNLIVVLTSDKLVLPSASRGCDIDEMRHNDGRCPPIPSFGSAQCIRTVVHMHALRISRRVVYYSSYSYLFWSVDVGLDHCAFWARGHSRDLKQAMMRNKDLAKSYFDQTGR